MILIYLTAFDSLKLKHREETLPVVLYLAFHINLLISVRSTPLCPTMLLISNISVYPSLNCSWTRIPPCGPGLPQLVGLKYSRQKFCVSIVGAFRAHFSGQVSLQTRIFRGWLILLFGNNLAFLLRLGLFKVVALCTAARSGPLTPYCEYSEASSPSPSSSSQWCCRGPGHCERTFASSTGTRPQGWRSRTARVSPDSSRYRCPPAPGPIALSLALALSLLLQSAIGTQLYSRFCCLPSASAAIDGASSMFIPY